MSYEEPKLISNNNSNLQQIIEETEAENISESITPRLIQSRDPAFFNSVREDVDFYKDRSNYIFLETYNEMEERIKKQSPFKHLKTWKIISFIVKSNDDVRQEQFAM